ncbi:MAG: hypothetical protein P1V20_01135 [Verrucomicrobiales bacterium]|nr:hypothetical protein [Verrucomicrobiales bacterium]
MRLARHVVTVKRLLVSKLLISFVWIAAVGDAQAQTGTAAHPNDVARFFAGLPVRPGSPLEVIANFPAAKAHAREAAALAEKWENFRLSQIRTWAGQEIHPKISRPRVVKYMFGGPDFVHATTVFPEVPEYILVGMEPLGSVPEFSRMNPAELQSFLSHLIYTMRSISKRSFFITKEMKEDFGNQGVDGVYPVLLYFAALTGHSVLDASYVKLDLNGAAVKCDASVATGIWLQIKPLAPSPKAPASQSLYYFKTDLSNAGFQAGRPFHKFITARPGGIGYLKAASYLMHTDSFSNIRNFLVGDCQYILQDASGIPANFFSQYYNVTYYGNYIGPIDMFSEYDQPGLRQLYQSGIARPLPFGTGYRMKDEHSIQMFGVRK